MSMFSNVQAAWRRVRVLTIVSAGCLGVRHPDRSDSWQALGTPVPFGSASGRSPEHPPLVTTSSSSRTAAAPCPLELADGVPAATRRNGTGACAERGPAHEAKLSSVRTVE